MRTRRHSGIFKLLCLVMIPTGCFCFAAKTPQPASTNAPAGTNAPAAEAPIPKSQFDENVPGGKDPFFPRSQRRHVSGVTTNLSVVAASISSMLELKGVSGSANKRLAVINNRSFQEGEEGEVLTAGGRVKIRCDAIRSDVVVVSAGSPPQRIELRMQRKL